jgi:hypothetical protein
VIPVPGAKKRDSERKQNLKYCHSRKLLTEETVKVKKGQSKIANDEVRQGSGKK